MNEDARLKEWFVPKFGPLKFRIFVGLLFLPYTGMCVSYTIIGSMLSHDLHWDRVAAIVVIYTLALGVSAHAADSLGSKRIKPWGTYFKKRDLALLMVVSLSASYLIGTYYIVSYVPLLSIVAILEGFFVFAYNFELLKGFFHKNFWFSLSWGVLPVLAGYVMQTNSIGILSILVSILAGFLSYVEIKISRSYKELKRSDADGEDARRLETILKTISLSTIISAIVIIICRMNFDFL
ncbi:MAG TPA: hypothetical protein VI033_03795 [Candidatus Nitrosopolaris sp.]